MKRHINLTAITIDVHGLVRRSNLEESSDTPARLGAYPVANERRVPHEKYASLVGSFLQAAGSRFGVPSYRGTIGTKPGEPMTTRDWNPSE